MKKLFFFLAIVLSFSFVASAQQSSTMTITSTQGVTKTSFTNADTAYVYASQRSLRATSFAGTVTVTQLTGTAGGSITWQATVDGVHWANTQQTATTISGTTTSGFAVSGGVPYNRYRALVILSGTETSTPQGHYYYKQ